MYPMMMEAPIAAIDSVVQTEELQQLFEAAELAGSVRTSELAEILDPHALEPLEVDAVYRMFEERGSSSSTTANARRPLPLPRLCRPHRSRRPPTRSSSFCARPAATRC